MFCTVRWAKGLYPSGRGSGALALALALALAVNATRCPDRHADGGESSWLTCTCPRNRPMLTGHFLCDQEDASQPAFATRVLGSAQVLDDGTPQANGTLAGIRALTGFPDGTGAEWRQTAPVAFEQEPLRAHPALDAERGGFYYPDSDRNLQ